MADDAPEQGGQRAGVGHDPGPDPGDVGGDGLVDHGAEDVVLGFEIEIERPLRHPGAPGDVVQSGRGEALLGEHLQGRRDDLGGTVGLAPTELGRSSFHVQIITDQSVIRKTFCQVVDDLAPPGRQDAAWLIRRGRPFSASVRGQDP
jgi:hypothetical protein